jgi:hypothetical protein
MTLKIQKLAASILAVVGVVMIIAGIPGGGALFAVGLLWFVGVRIFQ